MTRAGERSRALLAAALAALIASAASAEPAAGGCVAPAAQRHAVDASVLAAVLRVEAKSPIKSVVAEDGGTMYIGAATAARFGLRDLQERGIVSDAANVACSVAETSAWHLAQQVRRFGNSWKGIGAFASDATYFNNRFAILVHNELVDARVLPGPMRSVPSMRPSESPGAPGYNELIIHQVILEERVR